MTVIRLTATSGPDGVLHLNVPVGTAGEYDVAVVLTAKPRAPVAADAPEARGWPPGYFESTYGSITDPAFKRYPQGEFETREPLE